MLRWNSHNRYKMIITNYVSFDIQRANKYLLLAESEVSTVSYGPSFFSSIYGPNAKRAGHKSSRKTRIRNLQYEANKIFSIFL